LLVRRWFDDGPASIYGAAHTLSRLVSVAATPFHVLALPVLTGLHATGRPVGGSFVRLAVLFAGAMGPPLLLYGLFSEPIVRWTYGVEYAGSASLLLPLACLRGLGYASGLIALYFAAMDRFRFLGIYVAGLLAEIVLLYGVHGTLHSVVSVALVAQAGTFVALVVLLLVDARGRRVAACGPDDADAANRNGTFGNAGPSGRD
jgi:O-antigen/teichoic acid export membrane protein